MAGISASKIQKEIPGSAFNREIKIEDEDLDEIEKIVGTKIKDEVMEAARNRSLEIDGICQRLKKENNLSSEDAEKVKQILKKYF